MLATWTHVALAVAVTGGRVCPWSRHPTWRQTGGRGCRNRHRPRSGSRRVRTVAVDPRRRSRWAGHPIPRDPPARLLSVISGGARGLGSDGSYGSGGPTELEGVAAQLLVNLDFDELLEGDRISSPRPGSFGATSTICRRSRSTMGESRRAMMAERLDPIVAIAPGLTVVEASAGTGKTHAISRSPCAP